MPAETLRLNLTVPPETAAARLDVWLASAVEDLSRAQVKRLIDAGQVSVDGRLAKPAQPVSPGQQVTLDRPPPEPVDLTPEDVPLDILYEDRWLLVLNKPPSMVVHPARGATAGTLVHALLGHCQDLSGIGGELRPGIVHRLDKQTSGLLVVAKGDQAHRYLAGQLQARTMHRRYLALVWGWPDFGVRWVDQPIARHPRHRQKMAVVRGGRSARTLLVVRERYPGAALLSAWLDTGRTHQIRVHCTHLGLPVVADPVYGRPPAGAQPPSLADAVAAMPGQALHAAELSFSHPADGRRLHFRVEPPTAFLRLLSAFRDLARPPA